jgi:hypothetical protein
MNIDHRQIYIQYLDLLVKLLLKLGDQAGGDERFLTARLADDMFPLNVQARIAAHFALRACCPEPDRVLGGLEGDIQSLDGLTRLIREAVAAVEGSEPYAPAEIEDKAGFKALRMSGDEYVGRFNLPNCFFHIAMVYAIARNQGFALTKGDFDGIHEYPEGFSWER